MRQCRVMAKGRGRYREAYRRRERRFGERQKEREGRVMYEGEKGREGRRIYTEMVGGEDRNRGRGEIYKRREGK